MLESLKLKLVDYINKQIELKVKCNPPDVVVGESYLKRWHIIPENKFLNIYYHEIRSSDLDRDLHDHPYVFSSFILSGGYLEETKNGVVVRGVGDLNIHHPWYLHKLIMKDSNGANTIFITGPKIKEWGFMTEKGWVDNETYLNKNGVQNALSKMSLNVIEDNIEERKAS
jgi:hypothetical protein